VREVRLDLSTWLEVEAYLERCGGIIVPTGSTEQHGPIGLIGTDTLCARAIAEGAADIAGALVAPDLGYTPAPFNMAFAGSVSISEETFSALVREVIEGLISHGFGHIYLLNGHGANLQPLKALADMIGPADIRIRSWWDFEPVNAIRRELYGDWEGMHATPSEVAITQATHRVVDDPGLKPPEKLSAEFITAHAGDRHGPPDQHRRQFPDGRVGSHSSLARPEHGRRLLAAASEAVAADYAAFLQSSETA
jgi:creatinine amidohydrolase